MQSSALGFIGISALLLASDDVFGSFLMSIAGRQLQGTELAHRTLDTRGDHGIFDFPVEITKTTVEIVKKVLTRFFRYKDSENQTKNPLSQLRVG